MKNLAWLRVLFIFAGILFFAPGAFELLVSYRFESTAVPAVGVVVENVAKVVRKRDENQNETIETLYCPKIRFRTSSGKEIVFLRESVETNPPSFKVGETLTVLYDPKNPSVARVKSWWDLWSSSFGFLLASVVYFAWPAAHFAMRVRQESRYRWLRQHGTRSTAVVMAIEGKGRQHKGRNSHRVVCLWTDPGTNRVFTLKSDDLPFDPTEYLTDRTIAVIIDPKLPSRYLVETAFLPVPLSASSTRSRGFRARLVDRLVSKRKLAQQKN
jgi:hypothetical protein